MIKIIDPVMIEIFSFPIRWYGVIIISAILIALIILNNLVKSESDLDFEFFIDFLLFAFPLAIIGGRLYYVIFNLDYYLADPIRIIAFREGGLAIHGALIFAFLVLFLMSKKRDISLLKTLDYISPPLVLAQSIGRWGNFFNQEAYGRIVRAEYFRFLPDFIQEQMYIRGEFREPTFLYESAANFFIFIFLYFYLTKKQKTTGNTFAFYLLFYSIFRFIIEDLRVDSLLFAGLEVAKIVSLISALIAISLLLINKSKNN